MGSAGNSRDNKVTYVSIKNGGFCQESKQPREGFEQITVENPRTKATIVKYVKMYNYIEGYVKSIAWYDTEQKYEFRMLGYKLEVDIGTATFIIDIGANTPAFSTFAKQAEGIDFTQEVKFMAWQDVDGNGKKKNAFLMSQNGITLPFKYKKDNMEKCPEPLINEFDGKKDYGPQKAFFKKLIEAVVIPACSAAQTERDHQADAAYNPASSTAPPMNAPVFQSRVVEEEDDDDNIPF